MSDPRRIMITAHTVSSSPRARRWYGLIICVELDGAYWPVQHIYTDDKGTIQGGGDTLRATVAIRDREAARLGHPVVAGVWKNRGLGLPATRLGSPDA